MLHSERNAQGNSDWENHSLQNESKYCENPHVSCWCGYRVLGPQLTSLSCKDLPDKKTNCATQWWNAALLEWCPHS